MYMSSHLSVGASRPPKNFGSHIDASHSRQPLVKGERLVRYEVNAVMHNSRSCPQLGSLRQPTRTCSRVRVIRTFRRDLCAPDVGGAVAFVPPQCDCAPVASGRCPGVCHRCANPDVVHRYVTPVRLRRYNSAYICIVRGYASPGVFRRSAKP